MSKQAAVYRNNRFHHYMKLSDAMQSTALRARDDGRGFDDVALQVPAKGFIDGRSASPNDWKSVHLSWLPGGEALVITTKQLLTPKEKRAFA